MNKLYPLVFKPNYKEKIWGGNYFKKLPGLVDAPDKNAGEAWVLSGLEESPTIVANGFLEGNPLNELIEVYLDDIVGEKVYEKFGCHFPILLKIIDAADKLSIQVHPNDEVAAKLHGAKNGKTEMWFILNAEKNAWIINGFNKDVTEQEYLEHLNNGKIENILNYIKVAKDDFYFLPAGRIHAVGKGVIFAEVQQASDYTYRIYDWNRVDKDGNQRELHTNKALMAMNYKHTHINDNKFDLVFNNKIKIVEHNAFTTNLLVLNQAMKRDFSGQDTFIAYLCVEGNANIIYNNEKFNFQAGNAILIPAIINDFIISPVNYAKLIEVYI